MIFFSFSESPVIISSRVTRKQKTEFSVLFYSTSETHSIWRQLNHSLINSTKSMQTIDKQIIGVQFYNTTIVCEVYMANLSVSFPTGRYEIILQNAFGETKYYFTENGITSKGKECYKILQKGFSNLVKLVVFKSYPRHKVISRCSIFL